MSEPLGEDSRDTRVRRFFADPDRYLAGNSVVFVRSVLVGSILAGERPRRVLDLGCGDGSVSLAFVEHAERVTLVDRSAQMLERARARTPQDVLEKVEFVVAEIERLSVPRGYDLVLCLGVLAHVASIEAVIATAAASCAPGGLCIVQLTDSRHRLGKALRRYDKVRDRVRRDRRYDTARLTVPEVVDSGRRHGLRCRAVRRYAPALPGTGLLPLRWAQNLQLRLSAPGAGAGRGPEALVVFTKDPERGGGDAGDAWASLGRC